MAKVLQKLEIQHCYEEPYRFKLLTLDVFDYPLNLSQFMSLEYAFLTLRSVLRNGKYGFTEPAPDYDAKTIKIFIFDMEFAATDILDETTLVDWPKDDNSVGSKFWDVFKLVAKNIDYHQIRLAHDVNIDDLYP